MLLINTFVCSCFLYALTSAIKGRGFKEIWNLTPEEILQEAQDIVAAKTAFFNRLSLIKEPTVSNVLIPTIQLENEMDPREASFSICKHLCVSKEAREASMKAGAIVDSNIIDQYSDVETLGVYIQLLRTLTGSNATTINATNTYNSTEAEYVKFLKEFLAEFKSTGQGLASEQQNEVKSLQIDIRKHSAEFSENISEDDGYILFTRHELDGLPERILGSFAKANLSGKEMLKVTHDYTDILPVLQYAKNQETRKRAHLANMNRVPENEEILAQIVKDRFRIAKLLGFKSYSEITLQDHLVRSKEGVTRFLDTLQANLHPVAMAEVRKMVAFKNQHLSSQGLPPQNELYAWDGAYYTNLLYETEFSVDDEQVLEYFPLGATLNRTLSFFETLFDLKIEKEASSDSTQFWHNDVHSYRVYQNMQFEGKTMQFMGTLLFDLHPREGKFTHAGTISLQKSYYNPDGTRTPSVTVIVCNFSQATHSAPSLLKHRELMELFHELGHGFHNVLSMTKTARFQGTRLPKDFVECPSQMFEHWGRSNVVLKKVSGHYLTGKAIPDELIANVTRAVQVNKGLAAYTQLIYSQFDMALHGIEEEKEIETLDLKVMWNNVFDSANLYSIDGLENIGFSTFAHMVSGYESGYYGYLHSRVFAADIYNTLFGNDPANTTSAIRFRDVIFKNGGSRDASELLYELLGRAPNSDAFIKDITT